MVIKYELCKIYFGQSESKITDDINMRCGTDVAMGLGRGRKENQATLHCSELGTELQLTLDTLRVTDICVMGVEI